ncbi:MAG: tetratricopeptide repeat protein [Verrucomicrobia bacterium]|nr:tetratricopeptide repeat protein [Verrucomicrobiota bacterium]MCH8510794.1 tetratricopeptide repeat protein [Kiritimatiellia bacterium]
MNSMRILYLTVFCLSLTAFGQRSGQGQGRESILARFPYIPEDTTPSLLDVEGALRDLPELTFNVEGLYMPEHLLYSPTERIWVSRLREGHAHIQSGQFEHARQIFEEFLGAYPEHPPTRLALADTYFSLRNYPAAVEQYLDILDDYPNNFQALNNLAWLYATSNDPEYLRPNAALHLAKRAMVQEPNSHHVWSTLSQAHYAGKTYEEAVRSATMALNIARNSNTHPSVLVNYMNQLEKCQRALHATQILE